MALVTRLPLPPRVPADMADERARGDLACLARLHQGSVLLANAAARVVVVGSDLATVRPAARVRS